jgi:hypothetical protein
MQKMFLKGALVGALSSLLVTAATVAVAANGGNFILGTSNSATNVTGLSGTSANGMLNVVNNHTSATAPTVRGVSKTAGQAGVVGEGTNGPGVIGRGNPAVNGSA